MHMFADRKKIDPYYVAKQALEENKDFKVLAEQAYQNYPLAEEIYGSWENYASMVFTSTFTEAKLPHTEHE